jgi:phosphatidylglycerophosphatase A
MASTQVSSGWKASLSKWGTLFLSTGAFSGFFPVASGTAGTVVGVGVVYLCWESSLWVQVLLSGILLGIGVWASNASYQYLHQVDSRHIVIDEIVGYMVTMLAIPATTYWMVFGFVLFRFFDVVKFPPANLFDTRVKNGWGVMMDDVCAGIYGNVILHLIWMTQI